MKDEGWTQQRFLDAYKNIFKTHIWNTPVKPAEFFSWDKKVRLYTYNEISTEYSLYQAIKYPNINQAMYILKTEYMDQFPKWINKKEKKEEEIINKDFKVPNWKAKIKI